MASFVFDSFIAGLVDNSFDFGTLDTNNSLAAGTGTTDVFRIALVDANYTDSSSNIVAGSLSANTTAQAAVKAAHSSFANITEITGTTNYDNFAAGVSGSNPGTTLPSVSKVQDGTILKTKIDFADVTFTSATITSALGAVLYKYTGTANTSLLIAFLDFNGPVTSTSGDFTVSITTPLTFNNPAGS